MKNNPLFKKIYKNRRKIISIIISLTIIIVIYLKIDFSGFIETLRNFDIIWLIISLVMVIPITLLTTLRFKQLIPSELKFRFHNLISLILSASTLNMILPSKMGDIAKAFFMKNNGQLNSRSFALAIVIFEKTCDLLALLIFCLFGSIIYINQNQSFWIVCVLIILGLIIGFLLLGSKKLAKFFFNFIHKLSPNRIKKEIIKMSSSWNKMQKFFWDDKNKILKTAANSLIIWFLHLVQIWFFILALKAWVPFSYNLALAPLSILAGLLPLTFAGIGTRDAAIIFFFKPFFSSSVGAALGLLCTLRYIIPAIAGIPFFFRTFNRLKIDERQASK